jgi:hypothetical protein
MGARRPSKRRSSGVVFHDRGLRLMVLEALHEKGHFDGELAAAADACAAPPNEIDEDARAILDAIVLTPELLATVERIAVDRGTAV